jgi:polysaccharide export outer membrane protein
MSVATIGRKMIAAMALTVMLASCGGSLSTRPANTPGLVASAQYTIDTGDKLRIVVFGEADLSGEFEIDSQRMISMPLIGQLRAGGLTLSQLEATIIERLRAGYMKDPRVSIEVLNYRPFFILGEVNKPGSYPFVNGMTVLNAVAIAGGYTYRGSTERSLITRADDPAHAEQPADETTAVRPGDTIRVRERFF